MVACLELKKGFTGIFGDIPEKHKVSTDFVLDFGFLDNKLATVVTAFRANLVEHMPCSAVGADSECWDESLVVRTAFGGTGVRLSAFRMCHFSEYLICFCLNYQSWESSAISASTSSRAISISSSPPGERCLLRAAAIARLHLPSGCTCLIGIVRRIVSLRI